MALKARLPSTCPSCDDRIEVGDPISKTVDGWEHARHQVVESPPRPKYDDGSSTEVLLDRLVSELADLYPGFRGISATIKSRHWTVYSSDLGLWYWLDYHGRTIDGDDLHAQKPYLYRLALDLLQDLGANSHDGNSFPEEVWWPSDTVSPQVKGGFSPGF